MSRPHRAIPSDDDLLAAVLALPPARRWRHFDRLVGRPEVNAVGYRISERRLSPRPNAQRDAKWMQLHNSGLTYTEIAHAYNTSRGTVAKAVQRFRQRVDTDSLSTPEGGYYLDDGGKRNV